MGSSEDIRACIGRVRPFADALVGDAGSGDHLVAIAMARLSAPDHAVQLQQSPHLRLHLRLLRGVIAAFHGHSGSASAPVAAPAPAAADAAEAGATSQQRVRDALAGMSPEERTVLLLVALEGLTYAELAQVLDLPVEAALSRLVRARQSFATLRSGRSASAAFLRVVR
jgi:RNA polymerase sigma-70 factor (ECF subfamily)